MIVLNTLTDLLLAPFRRLPPEAGVAAFSLFLAVVVLLIFKATSNPERVRLARNRALARVMEMWLYRDDSWAALGAFGRVLRDNARYLGALVVPLLASIVPAMLLLVQAHDCFAARPLRPGETTLLVAQLRPGAPQGTLSGLGLAVGVQGFTRGYRSTALPAGGVCVRIDSPPVRAAPVGEIVWRLRACDGAAGRSVLALTNEGGGPSDSRQAALRVEKLVRTGGGLARVSQARVAGLGDWLLHPGEPRLPADQPLARLEVLYPEAEYNFLGLRLGWLASVLLLSLLAGLLLKRPMKVEF